MDSQYSATERKIAKVLSRFPIVKTGVKSAYARAVFLRNRKASRKISPHVVRPVGEERLNTFFGYYDKAPVSDDNFLLCHATTRPTDKKPDGAGVSVLVFASENLELPLLEVKTQAYNWQQGARAHWLDRETFVFNDFDGARQRYISRVFSLKERKEVQRYGHAVQDSFKRDYFLSINYRRIQALRPDYGYRNMPAMADAEIAQLDNDGIWMVDQESGDARLLYTISDVCKTGFRTDFNTARHKINHVMISPDGSRFIFLHRYFLGKRKFDRLVLGTRTGDTPTILSDHGMVSHCFWIDDHTVMSFMRGPHGKDGYYIVNVDTGQIGPLLEGRLDAMGDGHPHVHKTWFVTDTYPDKSRMQHLVRGDLTTGKIVELGQFYQSFAFGGESRCDLHPRISPDGSKVFFDSVFSGKRKLYMLDLAIAR
ncbi:glycosyl transferase [Parapusillimonas sp. SGNA-6]|nr:glycosyl transferase [Parapusillimonas sp. SGNA-6]